MKYFQIFILSYFLIASNPQTDTISADTQTIPNPQCLEAFQLKIFQVLDRGVLAHLCPRDFPSYDKDAFKSCDLEGDIVYMPVKPSENDYVDDQKISLFEHECFAADGVYTYQTKLGTKRVRKIKVVDARIRSL